MEERVKEVVYKMLIARRYKVDKESFMKCEESFLIHKNDDITDKMYVYFSQNSNKVGIKIINQYINEMKKNNVKRSLIIVKEEITSFAKNIFIEEEQLDIEYFKENELYIDKTEHVLVPKHELMTDDEKKELLKVYNIKDKDLPKIISSDPIARYYGAKKGQIFKITRQSETCGESIYYRIVV